MWRMGKILGIVCIATEATEQPKAVTAYVSAECIETSSKCRLWLLRAGDGN